MRASATCTRLLCLVKTKLFAQQQGFVCGLLMALLISTTSIFSVFGQSVGDYRSNAAVVNWNTPAKWQQFNGVTWVTATSYPGQNICTSCTVTIRDGHVVTLNVSPAFAIGSMVIGGGSSGVMGMGSKTLLIAGDLTVRPNATLNLSTGNLQVAGNTITQGTVFDNNNIGVNYFGGAVQKLGGRWTSTAVTNPDNLVFNAGIQNVSGAFTAGGARFNNNVVVDATAVMTFNNPLLISGAGDITIAGNGGVRLAGAAHYEVPGNLSVTGSLVVSTTGNFTVYGATNITGSGDLRDKSDGGVTTFYGPVVHNSSGQWVSSVVLTPAHMIFMEGFQNRAGAFFCGGATIGDDKTLQGDVTMGFIGGIHVLGNGDLTITGVAGKGAVFGGAFANYTFRHLNVFSNLLVSTSGDLTVNGNLQLHANGTFTDNNNAGISRFEGPVTIDAAASFTSTSVTTLGRLICNGSITQNNVTAAFGFSAGSLRTSGNIVFSGAGKMRIGSGLDISSGEILNQLSGLLQVSGTITGTVLRQDVNTTLCLAGANPLSLALLDAAAAGNLVNYNGASAVVSGQTYYHLQISGSGIKTLPAAPITVLGDLTFTAGLTTNSPNNCAITLRGNWINNAGTSAFRAVNGSVVLNGISAQVIGGTFATTFNHLTIDNAAGVQLGQSIVAVGQLSLINGIVYTNSQKVTSSVSGTITRTAGYINGRLERSVARGNNLLRIFDIGDSNFYLPVQLNFAKVTTAGSVTVSTSPNDHPLIGSATLDDTLSINRYWTISNVKTVFTTYTADLSFDNADKDPAVNTSELIAGQYNSSWTYPTVTHRNALSTRIAPLTSFGDFALAQLLVCRTPDVVINAPGPICKGTTTSLLDPAITFGSTAGLSYSYWLDSLATVPVSSPNAVAAGIYYIKGTTPVGGCHKIQPITISNKSAVTGVLSGSGSSCTGSPVNVQVAATGTGPWTGTLSDGTAFSGASSPIAVTVSPATTTLFTISTLSDASCTAVAGDITGAATVNVSQRPTVASAGTDQNICSASATLNANIPITGSGNWTIVSGAGGTVSAASNPFATFNGSIGVSYSLRWTISNAPCASSSDLVVINLAGSSWTGAIDTDWNTGGNWCSGIVPSGTFDVTLPAGLPNYPDISTDVSIRHLTIQAGASIAISSGGKLTITGTYANSGAIGNNGTIVLKGSNQQSFPGASASVTSMKHLEIDNASGVQINQSFNISGTLTPKSGTIYMNDKNITLVSTASTTARVGVVSGNIDYTGGGAFLMQRYFPSRRAWHLVTAPVTNSCSIHDGWQNAKVYTAGRGTFLTGTGGLNGLDAGNSSFKQWDMASQLLVPVTATLSKLSPGSNGRADNEGYYIFMRGDRNPANLNVSNSNATTLVSAGHLQTGPQPFTASTTAGKFTLIGNPYASAIDFNTLTRSNLLKRFYVWDPNLNSVGGYVMLDDIDNDGVFSSSVGGSSQTKELLSHQAFFVETASDGPAMLTINETDKVKGPNSAARPSAETRRVQVNLSVLNTDGSTVLADGAAVEFSDQFSDGLSAEDATKFSNLNEGLAFVRNSKALALERRKLNSDGDTLFMQLSRLARRTYQLQVLPLGLQSEPVQAVVQDNYLSTEHVILPGAATSLDFVVNDDPASSAANRFRIILKPFQVLPVRFTNLKATPFAHDVVLDWAVVNTTGIVRYELEHSLDGRSFGAIETVYLTSDHLQAGQYSHRHNDVAAGDHFYRVNAIFSSGEQQSSAVVKITIEGQLTAVSVFPNPVQDHIMHLSFDHQTAGWYSMRLINSAGQSTFKTRLKLTASGSKVSIQLPASVGKGVYHLEMNGPGGMKGLQPLIIQ